MRQILHTRKLEAAARVLAASYDRVLIRNKNTLWNPIRLRRKQIADLKPRIVLNPPAFNAELIAWNVHGGLLLYDRNFQKNENVAAHHAQLLSECPVSIDVLELSTQGTQALAVIYRPPRWEEHHRWVRDNYPRAELGKKLYAYAKSAERDASIAKSLKIDEGFTVCSDEETRAALGLTAPQLWRARSRSLLQRDYRMMYPLIPRVPRPEASNAERALWDVIVSAPDVNGVHLVHNVKLRSWKSILRGMVRSGSVEQKETICLYFLDGLAPDWDRVEAAHEAAMAKLGDIIKFVESTGELTLPAA